MVDKYRYTEVELSPEIMTELIVSLFTGKRFSRQECVDAIVKYHLDNGGICNHKSYVSSFKRATQKLRNKGYNLQNIGYGMWFLDSDSKPYKGFWSSTEIIAEDTNVNNTKEIGSGSETVYVYYYPIYRKYALLNNQSEWQCKIGMTTKNLWDRIYSQAATCFPEEPFIALIIKCDDARTIETILHKILKNKNKWLETAPGKEWFLTSPEEVENIYNTIQ